MNPLLTEKELEKLRRLGIVDETALRSLLALKEIERRTKLGEKKKEIMLEIAERLNISVEGLHSAIYRFKKKKAFD